MGWRTASKALPLPSTKKSDRTLTMQDIYVHPCEIWFGGGPTRLRTTLGSCVAITLWHPTLKIGGLCHFMISRSPVARRAGREGCYADSAMVLLQQKIAATGHRPEEFEAKLFGGGMMFACPDTPKQCLSHRVQIFNIAAGRALARQYGHPLVAEHLGGRGHRQLIFDIESGLAWLKHTPVSCAGCALKEQAA